MKDLLLSARYKAYENGRDIINIEDFKYIINNYILDKNKLFDDICIILDIEPKLILEESNLLQLEIDEAKSLEEYKFSSDLKDVIDQLKSKGHSTKTSSFYVEESFFSVTSRDNETKNNDQKKEKQMTKKEYIQQAVNISTNLSQKVLGQDRAVESISDWSIKQAYHDSSNEPRGIFLFLGPPATGKTYISELLGAELDEYKVIKFDMANFTWHGTVSALIGNPAGTSESGPGELTSFVNKYAKTVIVFDEIEKADMSVQKVLLSLLDKGKMKDLCGKFEDELGSSKECGKGVSVDFTQTVVVFTSNLGKELYNNHDFINNFDSNPLQSESMILEAISRETKKVENEDIPAVDSVLLSRLSKGSIILFNKLKYDDLLKIATVDFDNSVARFTKVFDMQIKYFRQKKRLVEFLMLSFAPNIDIRKLKSKIAQNFLDYITDKLKEIGADNHIATININISDNAKNFYNTEIKPNKDNIIRDLFRKNSTLEIIEKVDIKSNTILFTIDAVEQKQLPKSSDYEEGGISIEVPNIKFDDIAGHSYVKERLQETISLLKNRDNLKSYDAKPLKGMLLYGAPGTGKTMLAKAIAKEAEMPFVATTGAQLYDLDYLKKVFRLAREYAPAIIFIDEIDSVGNREGRGEIRVINELLAQIDGFKSFDDEIFIIAATNYIKKIDSAILRSGRIELHVEVPSLDKDARKYIINKALNKKDSKKVDLDKLVQYTYGLTGADIQMIADESIRQLIVQGKTELTTEILLEQINIKKYGRVTDRDDIAKELEATAYHEAGHAVLRYYLIDNHGIEQITVIPRDRSLGFVSFNNENSKPNYSYKYITSQVMVAYAGRECEIKQYGKELGLNGGASGDLQQATNLMNLAINELGMDDEIGYVLNLKESSIERFHENSEVISKWAIKLQQETKELVEKHWDKIEKVAKRLLEDETISGNELEKLLK